MNIIVTGSLGDVGEPLTETLLQKGHKVTVVSHSPERRQDIEALGANSLESQQNVVEVFETSRRGGI